MQQTHFTNDQFVKSVWSQTEWLLQLIKVKQCVDNIYNFDIQLSTEDAADELYSLHLSSNYAYSIYLNFDRISINFLVNSNLNNIAYHFNPRFDAQVLVRNNLVNNVWQREERFMRRPFTWSSKNSFKVCKIYV